MTNMLFFDNRISTNAYFNLALEEYFFKQIESDAILLWQSDNAIIVGKHQNALAEINLPYVMENNIAIARRLSGGGTVYHDLGNLNFTFIQTGAKEKLVDFARFIAPIKQAFAEMGLTVEQGKRNEILLNGKKISGNAEHTFKNRVLHHGTLLFNANLQTLVKSLRVNPLKFEDKAIKSVQSRVCNISDFLPDTDFEQFRAHLAASLMRQFGVEKPYELSTGQQESIQALAKEKYESWDWNFGYSPNYTLNKTLFVNELETELSIEVKRGDITAMRCAAEQNGALGRVLAELLGKKHRPEIVAAICKEHGYANYLDFF
ncbi:lipoate--protein ligase [bacterium]|nr:lipoate--protein ligase [bacterium]